MNPSASTLGTDAVARPTLTELPDVLYIPELAAFLGWTERQVRYHIDEGHIKCQRIGKRIVVPKRYVAELLDLKEAM